MTTKTNNEWEERDIIIFQRPDFCVFDFYLIDCGGNQHRLKELETKKILSAFLSSEHQRIEQVIKDSMWFCPSHAEVDLVKNACADCSEAASVNVILINLLKSLKLLE